MPNATPIIHIGFPKTASTWFQKSFYPHILSPRYIDRARVNAAFLEGHALLFDPLQARATLGLAEGESAILCEEGLCGYLHNGGVRGMVTRQVAQQIKAATPDARIVIFLRSQPRILVAAYQQYVRAGGTWGPHRYLFPHDYLVGPNAVAYKQPRFELDFFRYSRIVALYEELFGRDNVHLFLFEDFQKNGVEFLHDYAARLDLDVDWDRVSVQPRLASYGMPLAWMARFLNLFSARSVLDKRHILHIPGWYKPRRWVLEAFNRTGLFGKPPSPERLLGSKMLQWLEAYYARDNRLLAERRNLPLRDFGYPLADIEPVSRPRPAAWRRWIAR